MEMVGILLPLVSLYQIDNNFIAVYFMMTVYMCTTLSDYNIMGCCHLRYCSILFNNQQWGYKKAIKFQTSSDPSRFLTLIGELIGQLSGINI